jgi:hypothetical protein
MLTHLLSAIPRTGETPHCRATEIPAEDVGVRPPIELGEVMRWYQSSDEDLSLTCITLLRVTCPCCISQAKRLVSERRKYLDFARDAERADVMLTSLETSRLRFGAPGQTWIKTDGEWAVKE